MGKYKEAIVLIVSHFIYEKERSTLLDAFQLYKLPLHISQDYIDPVDGHVHRFQNRCLGTCSLKSGSVDFPQVTFYEITESEISESKLHQEVSSPEEDGTPESPPNSLDGLANFALSNNNTCNNNIKGLPPKKRKRRRVIRYEIIFTVDKGTVHLSPEHTFFVLPRDAVTECLTESIPHKVITTHQMNFFFQKKVTIFIYM